MDTANTVVTVPARGTWTVPLHRVGDFALAALWSLIAVSNIANTLSDAGQISVMSIGHQLASASVLLLCAALFIIRGPAKAGAEGLLARTIAIAGTWMMPVAIMMPIKWHSDLVLGLSGAALIILTFLVAWSVCTLRRSFSIFAEARELIRTGPYGVVRHPLYATYSAMYLVMLIPRFSPLALMVSLVAVGCEVWRARFEEGILRATFPEYEEYASVTPRFVPGIRNLIR